MDLLLQFLTEHSVWLYPLFFVLAWVEGPIVMLFGGFLLKLGVVGLIPLYSVLVLGDLCGDFVWYFIGYLGAEKALHRVGKFFSLNESVAPYIENLFEKHPRKILLISKMTMGFGFALVTLMSAGLARVPLVLFGVYNLLGELVWVAILLILGYWLGQAYTVAGQGLDILAFGAGIIIFLFLLYGFAGYMRQLIIKKQIT